MNPKYQIFISSTYEDLKEEREQVLKAVLRLGHIPIGMEMFNAANETQWAMIKRRIEESDYYIVIIARRYGSIEQESGLSYTEKEYDYATSIGIPTLGFVLSQSASWPGNRSDDDPQKQIALKKFINKVEGKMRSAWSNKDELSSNVSFALNEITTAFPRIGWVRANQIATTETINEMTRLSKENAEMREQLFRWQQDRRNAAPMPELNVDLKVVQRNYKWYEFIPQKNIKTSNSFLQPVSNSFFQPLVELKPRDGKWICLTVTNTGTSATDMSVKLDCNSSVINPEDIDKFEVKDKGHLKMPGVIEQGWHSVEHEDYIRWSFRGSIYSLRPGQSFEFLIPLKDDFVSAILGDSIVNINIFPVTGKHMEICFRLTEIL